MRSENYDSNVFAFKNNDLENWTPVALGEFEFSGILLNTVLSDHSTYTTDYYKVFVAPNQSTRLPLIVSKKQLDEIRPLMANEVVVSGSLNTKDDTLYVSSPIIKKKRAKTARINSVTIEGFCLSRPKGLAKQFKVKAPHVSGFPNIFPCSLDYEVDDSKIATDSRVKLKGRFEGTLGVPYLYITEIL